MAAAIERSNGGDGERRRDTWKGMLLGTGSQQEACHAGLGLGGHLGGDCSP